MKFPKKVIGGLAVLGFALLGCSGDKDTSIGSPSVTEATDAPATTVEETTPPTTPASPTTVEATTTTEAAPVYGYQLDGVVLDDCVTRPGECTGKVPADFPLQAQNPNKPGLTLAQVMALDVGDEVCDHEPTGDVPGTIGEGQVVVVSLNGNAPYVGIRFKDDLSEYWLDAYLYGVIPAPNGVDWNPEGAFLTSGSC